MPKKKRTLKEKRARKRNILIGVGVFALVVIVVGIGFLSRLPEVTITEVRVDGTAFIDEEAVRAFVHEKLAGSYLWVVPRKNTFFYPEHTIEKTLPDVFLPINLVDVTRDGFTSIVVAIEERQSVATWCASTASSSPCYLMDSTGFLFEEETESPGVVTYVGGVSGEPLGSYFIDGEFPVLRDIIDGMHAATNRSVAQVVIDEYDDIYVYFREGGEVRFVRAYEPKTLLDNIASVFSSRRFETEEYLEYADFRFGNKVYVKFSE